MLHDMITPSLHMQTGVWTDLPLVEKEFITPLRKGLRESRCVYSHKLTELKAKNESGV